jgi:uncharacterized LabA/DUF88 family protein
MPKGPGGVIVFGEPFLSGEPPVKRAVAFFDGQNLFYSVRSAFGYTFPNYDVVALGTAVCATRGWRLDQVRFYTGVPNSADNAQWSAFWAAKLLRMSRQGVVTFKRPLRYRNQVVNLPTGGQHSFLAAEEKGIDVRIAIDVIRLAHQNTYDVALVFSQDQDLSEVASEVRVIAREQNRWVKMVSAFPTSPTATNKRGINSTDWVPIERTLYDSCIDPRDYRPKKTV